MPQTPLYAVHVAAGATFTDAAGWEMPANYGDLAVEHRAVREAVGLIDLSHRGKLYMTGNDRQAFLHRIVTNDINTLRSGEGAYACMLTPQGKIIADMTVYVRDGDLLFDAEPGMTGVLRDSLDRYALMDDVAMEDVTERYGLIGVHGVQASALLNRRLTGFSPLEPMKHVSLAFQEIPLTVVRSPRTGETGYDLYVPVEHVSTVWAGLAERGARPVGLDALEVLRVEAGIPRYGAELDERIIPNEAVKERAVSFSKGCYIGQEPVVMMEHRGRPNKQLAGLRIGGGALPAKDATLHKDGQDAGWITSAVHGCSVEGILALGYVRRKFLKTGERLTVEADGGTVEAEIVELPFYGK